MTRLVNLVRYLRNGECLITRDLTPTKARMFCAMMLADNGAAPRREAQQWAALLPIGGYGDNPIGVRTNHPSGYGATITRQGATKRLKDRTMTKFTARIVSTERMPSSRNGNPRYRLHLDNGETHPTGVDSAVAYEITNPEFRDVLVEFETDKRGHVWVAHPVKI